MVSFQRVWGKRAMFFICRAAFVAFVRSFALFAFSVLETCLAYDLPLIQCRYGSNANCNLVSLDPDRFGMFYKCNPRFYGCSDELLAQNNLYSVDSDVIIKGKQCPPGFDFKSDLTLAQGGLCNSKMQHGVCVASSSSKGLGKLFSKWYSRCFGDWRGGLLGDMISRHVIFPSNYYAIRSSGSVRCPFGYDLTKAELAPDPEWKCFGNTVQHHKMCVGKRPMTKSLNVTDAGNCLTKAYPKTCYIVDLYDWSIAFVTGIGGFFKELVRFQDTSLHKIYDIASPICRASYSVVAYQLRVLAGLYNWLDVISRAYPSLECAIYHFAGCNNEGRASEK